MFHEQGSQSRGYDDHMRDSNWKEACGHGWVILTIASLKFKNYFIHAYSSSNTSKKLKKAMEGLSETRASFQGLTDSLSPEQIQDWKRQEKQASRHRGDALKIYEVQIMSPNKRLRTFLVGLHRSESIPLCLEACFLLPLPVLNLFWREGVCQPERKPWSQTSLPWPFFNFFDSVRARIGMYEIIFDFKDAIR